MRKLLVLMLVPAALAGSSAFAQGVNGGIASALPHPFEVEEAGDKLAAAVGAIVDVPIGGVLRAIDPASRAHADETIGDVAGREDPYFEERLQDEVGGLSTKAADLVRGLAASAPALERSLARLERDLAGALGGLDR